MNSKLISATPLFAALGMLVLSTAGALQGLPQGLWCGLGLGLAMAAGLTLLGKTPVGAVVRR